MRSNVILDRALVFATCFLYASSSYAQLGNTYGPGGPGGPAGANGTNGTNGTNGATGSSGTMAVGTVSTLPANSTATVVNVGNATASILNFGIPQGVIGTTGLAGTQFTSAQISTNTAGSVAWTYPALCNSSARFWAQPIVNTTGILVNVQNFGLPNSSTQAFQVNVTNFSTVALLGLTILSVQASPGTTTINVFCTPP